MVLIAYCYDALVYTFGCFSGAFSLAAEGLCVHITAVLVA